MLELSGITRHIAQYSLSRSLLVNYMTGLHEMYMYDISGDMIHIGIYPGISSKSACSAEICLVILPVKAATVRSVDPNDIAVSDTETG